VLNFQNPRLISKYFPWVIFLAALVVRLLYFQKSEVIDSDAVSRVIIAEVWLIWPSWIPSGIWGPFHTYLNAIPIYLFGERVISPVILHCLIGSLLVIPVYRFSERLFNANTGILAGLIVAFSPVVIRSSLQPMAEIPHAFFIASAMLFLLNGLQKEEERMKWFLLSGLFMTIASGFRYEAWVLIALFSLVIALLGKWKSLPWFWITAMIFPTIWMVGNYLEYGNIIYGADYATYYNTVVHGVNENLTELTWYKRVIFFPMSLFHIYPLPLLALLVPLLLFRIIKSQISGLQLVWIAPLIILLSVFIFKASGGTLLLQHRFSITLLLLLLPFSSVLIPKKHPKIISTIIILIIGFHLFNSETLKDKRLVEKVIPESLLKTAVAEVRWDSFYQLQSSPKLANDDAKNLLMITEALRIKDMPIIIDFFGWETTYNFALKSGVEAEKIVFLSPDVLHAEQGFKELERYVEYQTNSEYGIVILKENSGHMKKLIEENGKLHMSYKGYLIPLEQMDRIESIFIYKFDTKILKNIEDES